MTKLRQSVKEIVLYRGSLKELNSRDPERQYAFVKGSETFSETGIETRDSTEIFYHLPIHRAHFKRVRMEGYEPFLDKMISTNEHGLKNFLSEKGYDGAVHVSCSIDLSLGTYTFSGSPIVRAKPQYSDLEKTAQGDKK